MGKLDQQFCDNCGRITNGKEGEYEVTINNRNYGFCPDCYDYYPEHHNICLKCGKRKEYDNHGDTKYCFDCGINSEDDKIELRVSIGSNYNNSNIHLDIKDNSVIFYFRATSVTLTYHELLDILIKLKEKEDRN